MQNIETIRSDYSELCEHVRMVSSERGRRDAIRWFQNHPKTLKGLQEFRRWLERDNFVPISRHELDAVHRFFLPIFSGHDGRWCFHGILRLALMEYAQKAYDFANAMIDDPIPF